MKLAVVALILFALQSGPVAAQAARVWDFRVTLDESSIGSHRFTLGKQGEEAELVSEARFDVKLLFFTAYRYAHRAAERWRGNCLLGLDSRTDDNGKQLAVSVGRASLDGCVMSYAYWNPLILRQPRLLNAQTGEIEPISVAAMGDDTMQVRGAAVAAKRYRISGPKNPIDLWYSPGGEWLALESTLEGGRRLRYRLEPEVRQ